MGFSSCYLSLILLSTFIQFSFQNLRILQEGKQKYIRVVDENKSDLNFYSYQPSRNQDVLLLSIGPSFGFSESSMILVSPSLFELTKSVISKQNNADNITYCNFSFSNSCVVHIFSNTTFFIAFISTSTSIQQISLNIFEKSNVITTSELRIKSEEEYIFLFGISSQNIKVYSNFILDESYLIQVEIFLLEGDGQLLKSSQVSPIQLKLKSFNDTDDNVSGNDQYEVLNSHLMLSNRLLVSQFQTRSNFKLQVTSPNLDYFTSKQIFIRIFILSSSQPRIVRLGSPVIHLINTNNSKKNSLRYQQYIDLFEHSKRQISFKVEETNSDILMQLQEIIESKDLDQLLQYQSQKEFMIPLKETNGSKLNYFFDVELTFHIINWPLNDTFPLLLRSCLEVNEEKKEQFTLSSSLLLVISISGIMFLLIISGIIIYCKYLKGDNLLSSHQKQIDDQQNEGDEEANQNYFQNKNKYIQKKEKEIQEQLKKNAHLPVAKSMIKENNIQSDEELNKQNIDSIQSTERKLIKTTHFLAPTKNTTLNIETIQLDLPLDKQNNQKLTYKNKKKHLMIKIDNSSSSIEKDPQQKLPIDQTQISASQLINQEKHQLVQLYQNQAKKQQKMKKKQQQVQEINKSS